MSKELNQIQPLADEIEAWGDVPPLTGHTLFAEAATEKQRADLANMTLATLCDMVLGEDATDRSDDALVRAVGMLQRERDAAESKLKSLYPDVETFEEAQEVFTAWASAYAEHDGLIAELEKARAAMTDKNRKYVAALAANKRAKEYVDVFKRVNAAKRVWRKRAEQAEAKLVEAQARLIAGGVYEKLDSVTYWKARAEQAEADARRFIQFIDHDIDCSSNLLGDPCDCGLKEMRAKYLDGAK